jgi:hypothetical protein
VTERKYRQSSSLFCCSIKLFLIWFNFNRLRAVCKFLLYLLVSEVMGKIVDKNTPDEVLAELRLKHIGIVSFVSMSLLFSGFTLRLIYLASQIHPARSMHTHNVHTTASQVSCFRPSI